MTLSGLPALNRAMTAFIRFILGICALFPVSVLLAVDGNLRIAVSVEMTPEGRKFAHPTPDKPAYYMPVTIGYKEVGAFPPKFYQGRELLVGKVQDLLGKALVAQGYRVMTKQSPPSLVLVFRWGIIKPMIVHGKFLNSGEVMTYVVGDQWTGLVPLAPIGGYVPGGLGQNFFQSQFHDYSTDPATLEIISGLLGKAPSRYFLLVSALDSKAFQQHKTVLLWRAHVSVGYWGYFLDQTLPSMIAVGAPMFGREMKRPEIVTASAIPMGHVILGTPVVVGNSSLSPAVSTVTEFDRLQADTDKTLTEFAERAEDKALESAQITVLPDLAAIQNTPNTPPEAPRGESPDGIIRLPPYVVTDTPDIRWLYAAIPGFEILSSLSLSQTEEFARKIYMQQAWLNELAPTELQGGATVPTTMILFNEELRKMMSGNIAAFARANAQRTGLSLAEAGVPSTRLVAPETLSPSGSFADAGPLRPPDVQRNRRWKLIPQVKLWDEDSTSVDMTLDAGSGDLDNLQFQPDYVFYMLAKRAPPLPAWFKVGVVSLYQTRTSEAGPKALLGMGQLASYRQAMPRADDSAQYFSPTSWISPEVTKVLRYLSFEYFEKNHEIRTALPQTTDAPLSSAHFGLPRMLPTRDLLTGPPPQEETEDAKRLWLSKTRLRSKDLPAELQGRDLPKDLDEQLKFGPEIAGASNRDEWFRQWYEQGKLILCRGAEKDSPWRRDIWRSQAMLFVRWALDDKSHARSKALWKFASRASVEPANEAMFRECFGFGFAEADRQIGNYLPLATGDALDRQAASLETAKPANFSLIPETPIEIPYIEARNSTEAQEARLLGDWQRKEIEFVERSYPEYADQYATQAHVTLMRAYDDGVRDPGLLAAIGLDECAVGEDDQAQGFLEAAVQARVARPRAYVELARIRLAAAMAKPNGAGGKLDRGQIASALDLLQAARALQPPQLAAFLLAAEAWEHADFIPSPAELGMLDEGLHFFPDDPRLILAAAQLDAAGGLRVEAIRVLDRGLQRVSDPAMRKLFVTLLTRYAGGAN
jgi:hypothetical protein